MATTPETTNTLPADCIARVHTLDDLLLAIHKVMAMGAMAGAVCAGASCADDG